MPLRNNGSSERANLSLRQCPEVSPAEARHVFSNNHCLVQGLHVYFHHTLNRVKHWKELRVSQSKCLSRFLHSLHCDAGVEFEDSARVRLTKFG